MKSEQIGELAKALSSAQSQIRGALKDSSNPFFKSKYADLESCWDAIREPLTKNGLSVTQTFDWIENCGTVLVTTLLHSSGQWISGKMPLVQVKQDPQSTGSATTYMRRYALAAIVGLVQVDDDGEASHGRYSPPATVSKMPPKSTPIEGSLTQLSQFVVGFGKHKGKKLSDIEIPEIENYIAYIEDNARSQGKPIVGSVKQFMDTATAYVLAAGEMKEGA